MTNRATTAASAVGRTVSKAVRRLLGFLLLCAAIGLSTCHALEGSRDPLTPAAVQERAE